MKDLLIKEYKNTQILNVKSKQSVNTFSINFVDGAFLEVIGPLKEEYKVTFTNTKTNEIEHSSVISNSMWTRTSKKYCIDWKIEAFNNATGEKVYEHIFNPKNKRVYIHLDSGAVGDTLAWFPYAEEFRKKWDCEVICSTFHNEWFKKEYPQIEFVKPGTEVNNLYAMFNIGWFYDREEIVKDKVPFNFKKHPLQRTPPEILGLEYKEVKPKLTISRKKTNIKGKYVVIAPHASSHAKYWMHPKGWQTVIDYLNDKGYKVVMITGEPLGDEWHDSKLGGTLTGVINKTGYNIDLSDRMIDIRDAELFIGVGSGLSWLSWSIGTPTILISGFSYPYTEFKDCERIFTLDYKACTGCFNRKWLDPGDWEWCPDHKDTPRHFECTKTIKPDQVLLAVNKLLNIY